MRCILFEKCQISLSRRGGWNLRLPVRLQLTIESMNNVHDWIRPTEQDPRMLAKSSRYCSASQKGELRVFVKVDCCTEHEARLGLRISDLEFRSSTAISSSREPFGIMEARQKRIVDSKQQFGGPYRPVFLSTADFPTCAVHHIASHRIASSKNSSNPPFLGYGSSKIYVAGTLDENGSRKCLLRV